MSETPRTDALWKEVPTFEELLYHGRQLERELAAVTAERDRLRGALLRLLSEADEMEPMEGPTLGMREARAALEERK